MWIAVLGFTLWGLFPIYFKLFKEISPWEVVTVRINATFLFLLLYLLASGTLSKTGSYLKNTEKRNTACIIVLASVFLFVNWISYIIAISSGQVLSASLGYFISPIITVLIGILFLGERCSGLKTIAILLCVFAVTAKGLYEESFSIYSLLIGTSFSFYGVCKKHIPIPVANTLFLEMGILLLPSLAFLGYEFFYGKLALVELVQTQNPLALAFPGLGLVTILPSLLFAISVRKVDLSIMGFLQYLTPFIIFLLAIFLYHEDIDPVNTAMFILIWIAIILVSFEQTQIRRRKRQPRVG